MKRFALAALAGLLLTATGATAAPIASTVTCALGACTVTPNSGPVAVDPLGFTLELDWTPQDIVLDGLDHGDWWALTLYFDYTGTHDGTEHFGVITLRDAGGSPVPNLNEQFDDLHIFAGNFTAHYQIFNDGADLDEFLLRSLFLELSDGGGSDTLTFQKAVFSPASLRAAPEPVAISLLATGVIGLALRRFRAKR